MDMDMDIPDEKINNFKKESLFILGNLFIK